MTYTSADIEDINVGTFGDRYRSPGIILGDQFGGTEADALAEFERYGSVAEAWFTFSGHEWEDPEDCSTWGPSQPGPR